MHSETKIRVLVALSEQIISPSVSALINRQSGMEVCAVASDVGEARDNCIRAKPDVIVMDLQIAGSRGFEYLCELKVQCPDVRPVLLASCDDLLAFQRVFKSGVYGYIHPKDAPQSLISAVIAAAQGHRYVGSVISRTLADRLAGNQLQLRIGPETLLSDRELHIFRLLGTGAEIVAIGRDLRISVKTVETHIVRIKQTLRVRTIEDLRHQAARFLHAESAADLAFVPETDGSINERGDI